MTLDGKPDKRTKAVKGLLDFASLIECDYLKAEDGAQHMEEYLYDRGSGFSPMRGPIWRTCSPSGRRSPRRFWKRNVIK